MTADEQRDVGVGTSPDGRIALAIDGKGHIIDTDDAEWIAKRIDAIQGKDRPSTPSVKRSVRDFCKMTVGVGGSVANQLAEQGIETPEDVREAGFGGLCDVDCVGETTAAKLVEWAYGGSR